MASLRRFLPILRPQIRAYSSAPKPPSRAPPAKTTIPPTLPRLVPSLPYVPSTSHLRPADVALSSFFALHRPVSVRNPLPKPVDVEDMFGVRKETELGVGLPVREEDVLQVISVKRQRKLKMKKHKYKKLLKRTRNMRRRVERERN